ncbi:MAG TPA: FtsQ-type POTRA domain-containing protein, partial [Anaerolineae bacterium]|nr:FtsQ-type POTRA domain-containing protein [Anaerolineae bacterium]
MRRNEPTMRPRGEKSSRKRSPIKRRKRKPGLLKQPKRSAKGSKRRVNNTVAGWLPQVLTRTKGGKQQTRREPLRSIQDRKWRVKLRPLTSTTLNIRRALGSVRILSFSLLLLSVYAIWLIGNNPRFYLSRIEVEGATILQRGEIERASGVVGTHIFAIEPAVSAEQIQQMPGVLSAQVDLVWPDKLHITIEEETPILNWRENGRDYWVNASGTLIPAFGQDMNLLTIVANLPIV